MSKKFIFVFMFTAALCLFSKASAETDCKKKCCTKIFGETVCEPACKATCEAAKVIGPTLPDCGGDICDALEKGKNEVKNALSDVETTIRTGDCGGDICDTLDKAISDILDESERTGENLEEAVHAVGKFIESQAHGLGDSLSDAEKRVREGKVVDALWHLATDPVKNTEEAAAAAAMESDIIRAVGQVAAGAYGGPAGTAAYAAWLTYNETGDIELALKVGVITAATSYGNEAVAGIQGEGLSHTTKKAILSGAIGGISVAASGGDEKAMLDGFVLSAGLVVVKDGYKELTEHDLDRDSLKASRGEAYCLNVTAESLAKNSAASCLPTEDIFVRDENNQIVYEDAERTIPKFRDKSRIMAELDNRRPHVGKWSQPGETGIGHFASKETGMVMTGVSKIPGMNAMSVFHDQWAINWEMDPVSSALTIPPATVITYIGTGGPSYDLIRESAIENDGRESIDYRASVGSVSSESQDEQLESYIGHSFICTKADIVRQIALEFPSSQSSDKCRVIYKSEKGFETLWSAKNDRNYCKPHAIGFVSKQISEFGFTCSVQ
ncbi:hypothetical protein [Hyphomonas sp.]|uniref:hypothetical protein n=1 Tax=Hyphomonas sp. TaxID=87 RepID=UPI0025BA0C56|nr:hypothetical protein [Hyphomonas sp.]